ncbi:MAG TPA: dihydrolipoyl dehydrogenase [Candidatus Sulfomarinibacteraceae bacterium]|nr:dihydrolipoyl dehydrogenase [Candidatus Sulfomarinibacteraceae bacterium]
MANQYQAIVLGAGPAGYVAAIRAAQLGLKTAIVEKEALGGVCLNVGCIPSKALLKNAEVAHTLQHRGKEFGFSFENLDLDYAAAFTRSRQVSERLVKGVGFLMRKNEIDVFEGAGSLTGRNSLQVALNDGGEETLNFDNLILATGARPRMIPGVEVDGEKIVTYLEAIMSDDVPEKAVIIGAGPIGMEFAYVWANYGTDVTIVEMMSHLLPNEDPEVSQVVEKAYRKLGITYHTDSMVESVETTDDGVKVSIKDGEDLEVDQVLVAIGFQPNVDSIGLNGDLELETNEWGGIAVDEGMRTSVPNIYAVGDLVAPENLMLAHIGSAMGLVAAETIAEHPTISLEYLMLPRCTYCQPQVASFGYTEEQAQEEGYEINVGKFPFQPNGKALGLGERDGFIKIVADARYGEILGAHMVGPDVTELLPELTLARMNELTAEEIARNVHAHPTLSEVIMEAAHGVEGDPIHI